MNQLDLFIESEREFHEFVIDALLEDERAGVHAWATIYIRDDIRYEVSDYVSLKTLYRSLLEDKKFVTLLAVDLGSETHRGFLVTLNLSNLIQVYWEIEGLEYEDDFWECFNEWKEEQQHAK